MPDHEERWDLLPGHLKIIENEIKLFNKSKINDQKIIDAVLMPFHGAEPYLLHKAFIDAGGARMKIIKLY